MGVEISRHFLPWFPAMVVFSFLGVLCAFIYTWNVGYLFLSIIIIYFLPVIFFRLHGMFVPTSHKLSRLDAPSYSAWWASYQFQLVYNAFPVFEVILRLIPGMYSAWLRLWGSRIGRGVYWTPLVEIIDRHLLDVGHHVIFGHKVTCCSHVISSKMGELRLFVKPVKIGNHVLIGAGSNLGPGTSLSDHTELPYRTYLTVNNKIFPANHG